MTLNSAAGSGAVLTRNQFPQCRYREFRASVSIGITKLSLEETMRDVLRGFAAFLVFATTVAGQAAPAKPNSTQPSAQKSNAGNAMPATGSSIDPGKEADIRR